MRCAKCGYVTFDRAGECPRCGKSLPEPLVATAVLAPAASRAGRPAFLSSLMLGPIPRFYGDPGDPAVPSLLDPEEEGLAGSDLTDGGTESPPAVASRPGGGEDAPAASRDDLALEDALEGMEEPAAGAEALAPPIAEPPAARAPRRAGPPSEEDDPLASLDLGASLELTEAPTPARSQAGARKAGDPGDALPVGLDAALLDDNLNEEEAPSAAPARAAQATGDAGGASTEAAEEDLAALFADEEAPAPAARRAREKAPEAPAASQEDEDVLSILDEADAADAPAKAPAISRAPESVPSRALPAEEAPGLDALDELGVDEAGAAPDPASPAALAGPKAGEEEDISNLWAEAFTEAAPSPPGLPDEQGGEFPAARSSAAGDGGAEDMWAGALEEGGGAPAPAKREVAPPVGASAGGGEDSLSDMWSDAFAEQEAAAKAQREGKKPQAGAADLGEGDLEQMWSEALNESGDAPRAAAPAGAAPAEAELPKEDLAGFLDEGEAVPASTPAEDEAAAGDAKKAPVRPGGGLMADDEDSGDIEAYVPDEAPAAAAPPEGKAPAGDFFEGGAAAPEEPEEEEEEKGKAEVIGVPLAARAAAGAVDFGVLAALQAVFAFISHGIVSRAAGPVSANMEALILLGLLNGVVLFLLSIFYSVYFVGMFGCTPGQRCMGLSVVDMEDKPVQYMQAILRYFGGLAATLPLGAGHLLVPFDKKRRGIGDRLAGTRVVLKMKV
ncbi:MAG: RDD family protein [Candidatus Tectomicrobia bacterium]|uniref:RDD family protein n=1 Tax=Tectimicrobiota bacterium TaxID=2528274 RepID=A0A932MMU3_UNCTE|nr:RDD family protein [Candidatus Tectomicrobia bacterium]